MRRASPTESCRRRYARRRRGTRSMARDCTGRRSWPYDPAVTVPRATALPIPAATVVLLRPSSAGPEVLLTRRPTTMAFAADVEVFPGGRVDDGDGDPRLTELATRSRGDCAAALGGNETPADALAIHLAAIRELVEEAGILLSDGSVAAGTIEAGRERLLAGVGLAEAFGGSVRFATDRLVPIGRWTTPPFMARRFATWFFVADLPDDLVPTFHAAEVVSHRWVRPAAALDELAAGAPRMWVPTTSVLQQLVASGARSAAEVAERITIGRS